jgi:hypothetical protein
MPALYFQLLTLNSKKHAPDPGNAGVGRGNKLSVLPLYPGEQMV